jgi:quercetin dioxygenase-like cupin family protein
MQPKVIGAGEGCKLNVIGDCQNVRLTGADTGGRLALIEQNNAPGAGIPLHVHTREDEVFHVLEGQVEYVIAGQTVSANAGTTVFAPRDVPHSYRVTSATPARVLVTIIPAGVEAMFVELSRLPAPPDMARVTEICGRYGLSFV